MQAGALRLPAVWCCTPVCVPQDGDVVRREERAPDRDRALRAVGMGMGCGLGKSDVIDSIFGFEMLGLWRLLGEWVHRGSWAAVRRRFWESGVWEIM